MKEKISCEIIKDLLPNYIEKLTSEETNEYIEEHLKNCEECQKMLNNMQENLNLNSTDKKESTQEINYIKKFAKKLALLRNILLIIITLFIIIVARKTIILTSLSNKEESLKDENNYYIKTEFYSQGAMSIMESYCKDDKILSTNSHYQEGYEPKKITIYKSKDETIMLIDNDGEKVRINDADITVNPISFTSRNLFENIYIALTTSLDKKVNLYGEDCYIIRNNNKEQFIDAKTGLPIKEIDNENNTTTDYQYKYGVVKDSDVEKPNTDEYVIEGTFNNK